MMEIPEMNGLDVAFGNVKHMPPYDKIPDEFKRFNGNDYVTAVSKWFFKGAQAGPQGLVVDGVKFTPKEGVDQTKALAAIRAVLGSFEPKHEHKEAACAFMLAEWFSKSDKPAKAK